MDESGRPVSVQGIGAVDNRNDIAEAGEGVAWTVFVFAMQSSDRMAV